jgi:uncharacterized RDD family membrane protein YckC
LIHHIGVTYTLLVASPSTIDTLQKIELAEGVQILIRPAGPGVRMLAYLIDTVFWMLWLMGIGLVAALFSNLFGGTVGTGLWSLGFFVSNWFYFVFYEVRRGASPGKRRMGLRVVRSSGAPVGWGPSMLRNLLRFVDFLPIGYLFGLATCLANRKFQRIGDFVADTVVVHDRLEIRDQAVGLRQPVAPMIPPMVLGRDEQLALVQFIERVGLWSDSRKEELADILEPLTRAVGKEGVRRTLSMGAWIRDS